MLLFMMEKANNCFSAILKGRVSKLIYFLLWYMLTYLRFDEFTFLFFFFITRGFNLDHFMGNRWGNSGNSVRLYFFGGPKSLQMVTAAMKLKDAYSLETKL